MTPDSGFIHCRFDGPPAAMDALRRIAADADRQDRFSCGLSWLDELDSDGEAQSDAVSYDSIGATQEFLSALAARLPELRLEGRLEHSWPVLPCCRTVAEFSAADGVLHWQETREELTWEAAPTGDFFGGEEEEEDPEDIEIPLTPWD